MKSLTVVSAAAFAFLIQAINAQTLNDAVRYSLLEVGGTARTAGVGGALSALGADFSVLSTNPAGLAAYRRSEFVFTPTWERATLESRLNGEGNFGWERGKNNFNFNNIGLVFSTRPLDSKWTVSAFGLGLNRMANLHEQIYFEGSSEGSITDRWLELADGKIPDDLDNFEAGLAFDGEAIFSDPDDDTKYQSDFLPGDIVEKSQLVRRKGSINEMVFTFAGNYDEKLLIGATLGIPFLNYEEIKTYKESDEGDAIPVFDNLTFTERLRTSGAGINLKVGLIYRFNQMIRLGFALHTPTSFSLDDSFSTSVDYRYTLPGFTPPGEVSSPDGTFEYKLRTPWRFIGGAGIIIDKSGFLSAELEYVDYTNAKFNFNNTTNSEDIKHEQALNNDINNILTSALNIRLGGEFAYDLFRFRAGYSLTASPYLQNEDPAGAISFGAGVRQESIFLDFAFRRTTSERTYSPYLTDTAPLPIVSSDYARNKFMLTVGFKF